MTMLALLFPNSRGVMRPWSSLAVTVLAALIAISGCTQYKAGTYTAGDATLASVASTIAQPGEELWVIARHEPRESELKRTREVAALYNHTASDNDSPGTGSLLCRLSDAKKEITVPLQHTDVRAEISAYIASVRVQQQFHNPYSEKIEATYVFPLPGNAAVNGFVMTVGDRRIRGIIREREEAKRIYEDARAQGHVASLLTQERPNIFTQKVANIEPGKDIDVDITYFHTLTHDDGWLEFVFPMVVGPRFNPPGSTTGIDATPRGQTWRSNQPTAVGYLKPGERSGHDIDLRVEIDAGVDIEKIVSVNHIVDISDDRGEASQRVVTLNRKDRIPNKDFVLRFRVGGERIQPAILAHRSGGGGDGFFTMVIHPPRQLDRNIHQPLEMIFVLDCSGSMAGKPIKQAKDAVEHALGELDGDDTFQIINFSNDASQLGREPLPATRANLRRGRKYLRDLEGEGGTMMIEGIKAALDFPHDDRRLRTVCFLTDGYIGNEAEIFAEVNKRLGESRLFSFGVGSSVNRHLLDGLARFGRGAVAYLSLNYRGADVMDQFLERARHVSMTDVRLEIDGVDVDELYPSRAADLFVGKPLIFTGKYRGSLAGANMRVTGRIAGRRTSFGVRANDHPDRHAAIAAVWARARIADLSERLVTTRDPHGELASMIRQTALDHSLVSDYTAFVAVDSRSHTAGDHGVSVDVPVPVPDGVRYDTAVGR